MSRDVEPVRVHLRRTKGWRMPENTVSVARPTKWGNPFAVGASYPMLDGIDGVELGMTGPLSAQDAVHLFSEEGDRLGIFDDIESLRGKNLACWCKPGSPCHADVLLKLANQPKQGGNGNG